MPRYKDDVLSRLIGMINGGDQLDDTNSLSNELAMEALGDNPEQYLSEYAPNSELELFPGGDRDALDEFLRGRPKYLREAALRQHSMVRPLVRKYLELTERNRDDRREDVWASEMGRRAYKDYAQGSLEDQGIDPRTIPFDEMQEMLRGSRDMEESMRDDRRREFNALTGEGGFRGARRILNILDRLAGENPDIMTATADEKRKAKAGAKSVRDAVQRLQGR